MYIHTHGTKGDPVIILLHPMGITGEKMYEVLGSKFEGRYHFITPDMGSHGSEKRVFRSAKAEAAALHNYLQQNGLTQIRLLYGASLGCAVSLHLLAYGDLNIEHVYLDGAPVARLGFAMRKIFAPVLVWQQDMIIKNREKGISDFVKRYGRDIAEHMADSFLAFDKESICHIGRDCVVGNTPDLSGEIQKRINQGIGYFSSEIGPSTLFQAYKTIKHMEKQGRERSEICEMLKEKFGEKNSDVKV